MKRGQTYPWRMRYTWSNGARGTRVFATKDEALEAAARQLARTGPNGATCTAYVEHRDQARRAR